MMNQVQLKAHEEWGQQRVEIAQRETDQALHLVAMAHLNLMQHLKYGFDPKTAHSTLISVGQIYPKLKAKMNDLTRELENKNG
jgi:hypothetical protein